MPQLSTKEGMIFNLQDSICTLRKDVARIRQKRVNAVDAHKVHNVSIRHVAMDMFSFKKKKIPAPLARGFSV